MNNVSQTLALTIDKMLYMCIYVCIQIYIYYYGIYLYVSHKMISIVTTICLDFGLWSLPLVSFSLPFLGAFFL